MYTPTHFNQSDRATLLAFMQRYSFATLVTARPGEAPVATHLPFTIEIRDEVIWLVAHMARLNPQWQHFAEGEVLVIFQEPHAYISPRWYDKELSVPTWNYAAVHAYGRPELIESEAGVFAVLEKLITASEAAYLEHWKRLPEGYKTGLAKGLVAFELEVTRLEGKEKMSQNRTEKEIGQVIAGLEQSEYPGDREMAALMQEKYGRR
ncbi:MAG: FMN-binding negative transcriptional regulator [Saprospiraceae bacterium]|nr:FMN-binding negative transcriptional regulator [Saprospiraceae bacterium]